MGGCDKNRSKIKVPRNADVLASWGGLGVQIGFGKMKAHGLSELFEFPQGKFHPLYGQAKCVLFRFNFSIL